MGREVSRSLISRPPRASLRAFVRTVWVSNPARAPSNPAVARERVLPTGRTHLVFRMSEEPLRLFDGPEASSAATFRRAMVGGPRSALYVRDISNPAPAFGAEFHAGAAGLLLGVPADALADRHTSLDALWGSAASEARERLAEACSPEEGLALFESMLEARLLGVRGPHPAVAHALRRLAGNAGIGEVVEETGYSHRRFIELFRRAVGLTPKVYCRLLRFQHVLALLESGRAAGWSEVALSAGYSDQAHFNREFREFAGLAPGEYRALAPRWSHHVPVRAR